MDACHVHDEELFREGNASSERLSLERSGQQTEKPSLAIVEILSGDHHATPFSEYR